MATKSPSYALFFGQQALVRATNDTDLTGNALTISVTFDAFASEAAQDGTIAAKHHGSIGGRQGWRVFYDVAARVCGLRVYDSAGNWVQRVTTATLPVRANVTCVFNGGAVDLYVNGVLSNGTLTSSGSATTMNATVEPLSFACDSASTSATNPWKGALHFLAIWSTARTGTDISTMTPNGLIGSAFSLADADLKIYYRDVDVTGTNSNDFVSWADAKQSRPLTHLQIGGARLVKVQPLTGVVLTTRLWDANLSDQALYTVGLTTTYTLAAPYRLWGAALSEPQISSNFSSTQNDFTLVLKVRKVAGRTSAVLFRKRGINVQFTLGNRELFVVVGDDVSGTLQNKRISFGLNLFPIEGTDAVLVFRYNAVERDVDLFINQIGYTGTETVAATNANETTTGLFLAESCDFISAAFTPACLSDAQVDAFVLGTAQLVYSVFGNAQEGSLSLLPTHHPDPVLPGGDAGVTAVPVMATESVPNVPSNVTSFSNSTKLAPGARVGSYDVFDSKPLVDDPTFIDPLPVVNYVTLSGGSITASGSAGYTDAYLCRTWWEIELVSNQLQALGASTYPRNLFESRVTFVDTFTVPPDVNLAGRAAVLVVQPQKNSKQTFRSAPYLIDVVAPTDPVQVITSATIASNGNCTVAVTVGPTNAGPCTTWYEAETAVGSGTYARVSGLAVNQNFAAGASLNETFSLGLPTGWTGRRLRFVINPDGASTVFFYGSTYTLTDFAFVVPTVTVTTVTMTAARVITANGTITATNVGTATTWWELAVTPGVFEAVCAKTVSVDVSDGEAVSNTFAVPLNFSLTGKNLRLAIQGTNGPVYYSAPYSLTETQPTDPTPLVTAATCTTGKLLTASATLGTCTLPAGKLWWEIDYSGTGQFVAVLGTVASISMASASTPSLSYQFPNRFDLTGKSIRLVVQSTSDPRYSWASAPFSISQTAVAAPAVTLSTVTTAALGSFAAAGSIGASNAGSVTAWVEVDVDGDGTFKTVLSSQTLVLSAGSATPFSAALSLTTGPDLTGALARLRVQSNTFPELTYQSSAVAVTNVATSVPALTISAATETAGGSLTLTGSAGPTTIGLCDVWFETTVGGVGNFDGRLFYIGSLNLTSAQGVGGTIQLPNRLTLGTKNVTLVATPAGRPDIRYTSTPAVISTTPYVSPAPAVTAATLSPTGVFTYSGTAGASNIGAATYWVEVAVNGTFTAVIDKKAAPTTSSAQALSGSVTLPGAQAFTSTSARIVYQQNDKPDILYYSATFPISVVALGATPIVQAATYTIESGFDCTVQIPGSNNFGAGFEWWEIEVATGVFMAVISRRAVTHSTSIHTSTVSVTLPDRFDLQGKSVRYAFSPTNRPDQVIYSALFAINVALIADPGPLIQSYTVDPFGRFSGVVRAGPTNAAFCRVWWEVGIDNSFTALLATQTNVNLFSQQIIANNFDLPLYHQGDTRYDYVGKSIRFAVQTNIRPELVYYSAPVSLNALAPIDPQPEIITASASTDNSHSIELVGQAGPSNLEMCWHWWEVTIGTFGVLRFPKDGPTDLTDVESLPTSTALPFGLDLQGRELRLVVAPVLDSLLEYRSAPLILEGEGWANFAMQPSIEVGRDLPVFGVFRTGLFNNLTDAVGVVWYEAGTAQAAVVDGRAFYPLPLNVTQDMLARTTQNMIANGDLRYETRLLTQYGAGEEAIAPVLNPGGTGATTATLFSLWTPQTNAEVRYTVNGDVPSATSPLYTGPFFLGVGNWTIRAIAILPNLPISQVMVATVTVSAGVVVPPAPVVTSSTTTAGTEDVAWTYQITATNSPTSFGATGLPAWASLNSSTGLISGTPDMAGALAFSVTATNAGGTSAAVAVSGSIAAVSQWIGAWAFNGGSVANMVTGASGGDFSDGLGEALVPISSTNGFENGYCIGQASDPGYITARACVNPSGATIDLNQGFTVAAFIRYAATPYGTEQWINLGSTSPAFEISLGHVTGTTKPFRVDGTFVGTSVTGQVWPGAAAGVSRFIAVTVTRTGATLVARRYVDGVLLDTHTLPLVTTGGGIVPAKLALALFTFYSSNALWLDNINFTRDVLSEAEIVALAAGRMPNAAGVIDTTPVPLADPSKWIGAWSFQTNALANTVGPAGPFVGGAWVAGVGVGGSGAVDGTYVTAYPEAELNLPLDMLPITERTLAAFVRVPQPFMYSSGLDVTAIVGGGGYDAISGLNGLMQSSGQGFTTVGPFSGSDAAWRHLAIRVGATQWQVFVNGTLVWSSGTYSGGEISPLNPQAGRNYIQLATHEGGQFDNIVFTREALSDAAIAALAAGAMPNSSGVLVAP
jgi:hypothetical protein